MIWIRKSSTSTWREIHHWIDPKSPVRMPGSPKQGGRTIQDWDFRDSWIVYLFLGDHQSPRGIQIALRIPYCGWAYGHQKSRVLTHSRGCLVDTLTSIWRFPKIGLPPNHPFNRIHDFPWNKPSSYGGTPPIYGNPYMTQICHVWCPIGGRTFSCWRPLMTASKTSARRCEVMAWLMGQQKGTYTA